MRSGLKATPSNPTSASASRSVAGEGPPGAENWVEARQAYYVIGSSIRGGMGAPETVPFSTRAAADEFASENGGEVVSFPEIPPDYVLGTSEDAAAAQGDAPLATGATH